MPPEVDRWAYSSRVVGACDGAISIAGAVEQPGYECLAYVVDFPLRQRKHRNDVHASGEGLRGFGQGRVPR